MSAMRYVGMVATVGFVLALPILLFTTNIRFLASDSGYLESGIRRHDAPESTGIALGELDYAVGAIVRYFEDDAETLRLLVFADGEEAALFSAEETIHMQDVKGLMRTIFRANEVSLGFVLAYVAGTVLWSGERSGRGLAKETLAAVGVGAALGLAVGILAIVGFDSAWERMHEIIFTNDFWLLDPTTDRLIQMFPEAFWQEATFIVVGLALGEAVVLIAVAGAYLWFTRTPRPETDEVDEAAEEASEVENGDVEDLSDEVEAPEGENAAGDAEAGGVEDAPPADEEPSEAEAPAEEDQKEPQPQPPPPQAQPPAEPSSGSS